MTPDQVSGLFDAGEAFVEGTIAAALVVLWLLALALHLGRGYMVRTTGKFTLRLGADLWWIIYVGLRDLVARPGLHRQLHLLLPGRRRRPAAADHRRPRRRLRRSRSCSSSSSGTATRRAAFRWEVLLLGLGATLYIVPYLLGVQMTELHGQRVEKLVPVLVTSLNPDLALPLCYLSGALIGVMGLFAVYYNLRSTGQRPAATIAEADPMNPPLNADDLATALTNGAAGWLVLSVAAVLPMIWTFTLVMHFARPTIMRFLQSLTLRFGGDVWWLSYVLFRDALLVITLGLSMLFFMPNLYFVQGLPITAPLSVAAPVLGAVRQDHPRPGRGLRGLPAAQHPARRRLGPVHRPADLRAGGRRPGEPRRHPEPAHQQQQPGRRPADLLGEPGAVRRSARASCSSGPSSRSATRSRARSRAAPPDRAHSLRLRDWRVTIRMWPSSSPMTSASWGMVPSQRR